MTKEYKFINYSFARPNWQPQLVLQPINGDTFEHWQPRGEQKTLKFLTGERFCTGWHDLESAESFACPDQTELSGKYTQCRHCQLKTGFNPAFYNADSVSPQQQIRNSQPHILYLAHFAPGVIKVGISWAKRDLARLLDQGARSALIVKTYPTANIARQYEAKIAGLPGISETLQVNTKHKMLAQTYNAADAANELANTLNKISQQIGVTPDDNQVLHLDKFYIESFEPQNFVLCDNNNISGKCVGMVGSTLITKQNGQYFGLSLRKFLGCKLAISEEEIANTFTPQQASLF